jgi:hypothetical protein
MGWELGFGEFIVAWDSRRGPSHTATRTFVHRLNRTSTLGMLDAKNCACNFESTARQPEEAVVSQYAKLAEDRDPLRFFACLFPLKRNAQHRSMSARNFDTHLKFRHSHRATSCSFRAQHGSSAPPNSRSKTPLFLVADSGSATARNGL